MKYISNFNDFKMLNEKKREDVNLLMGRFQPFHLGHLSVLENLTKSNGLRNLVLVVVKKNRDGKSPFDLDLMKAMMNDLKKQYPKLIADVYFHNIGFLGGFFEQFDSKYNAKMLGVGSDRAGRYYDHLKYIENLDPEFEIKVIDRIENEEAAGVSVGDKKTFSGSAARDALIQDNKKFFLKMVPRSIGKHYGHMKDAIYKVLNEGLMYLKEGGRVFLGKTSRVPIENIQSTINAGIAELKKIFPGHDNMFDNYQTLGSVGKKPSSGDIDLAFNFMPNMKTYSEEKFLKSWNINKDEITKLFDKFMKRARTAEPGDVMKRAFLTMLARQIKAKSKLMDTNEKKITTKGILFTNFPQYDPQGVITDDYVQFDLNFGDMEWLNFAYFSDKYPDEKVKGLHRTQLILALFGALDIIFDHGKGIIDKETRKLLSSNPKETIKILNDKYNMKLTVDIAKNYHTLHNYIKNNLDNDAYSKVIDRYIRVLDITRTYIPVDLHDYWITNKGRLNLNGKFLPEDSPLKKYI